MLISKTAAARAIRMPAAVLIMFAAWAAPSYSSNPQIGSPSTNLFSQASSSTVSFGSIPASAFELVVSVEGAKLTVHRLPGIDAIKLAGNCPNHWNVSGNTIRQVALQSAQKGVSIRADAAGAQALVNGRIYQLPRGADGAVHSLKIENGEVIINGERLEPLLGSDVPGTCTGADVLDVQVPENYNGSLILTCHGASSVQVDSWQGGNLVSRLNDSSDFKAGNLQGLIKAVIDTGGQAKAQVDNLSTKALVVNTNGGGSVTVSRGYAEMTNATISGGGNVVLKGKFKNLRKSVNGAGTIQIME